MKTRVWIAIGACAALGAAFARPFQDETAITPVDPAAMEKMIAFGTPGEAHELLANRAGKWNLVSNYYPTPGAPAQTSEATAEIKWVMDGRYLLDETHGSSMGMPFEGLGILGYDNLKQKYFSTWIDNFGTGFLYSEGSYDEASKSFTFEGTSPDPVAGKYVTHKSMQKWIDADNMVYEWHAPGPDGAMYMMMDIAYTRAE